MLVFRLKEIRFNLGDNGAIYEYLGRVLMFINLITDKFVKDVSHELLQQARSSQQGSSRQNN